VCEKAGPVVRPLVCTDGGGSSGYNTKNPFPELSGDRDLERRNEGLTVVLLG